MKTVGKILKNSILIISTLIIMLFLLLYLIFQVPAVQHFVIQKAQQKTKEAANISFTLDHFTFLPPNKLKLSTIMVEGSDSDTLLYSKELTVQLQLRALLSKKISIESVNIDSTTIKLKRITETGKFNFHFSEDPAPADTASTTPPAWEFTIKKIGLQQLAFQYEDMPLKNEYEARIGAFTLELSEFDPSNNRFVINKGELSNSSFRMLTRNQAASKPDTTSTSLPFIGLDNELMLTDISVAIRNKPQKQQLTFNNFHLSLSDATADLANELISLEKLTLRQARIDIIMNTNLADTIAPTQKQEEPAFNWQIRADEVLLEENSFRYSAPQLAGLSPLFEPDSSLAISHLSANFKQLNYSAAQISGEINHFSFLEQSGFQLKNLQTKVKLNNDTTIIQQLQLHTNQSKIILHAYTRGVLNPSPNQLFTQPVKITLAPGYIGFTDVTYFAALPSAFSDSIINKKLHFQGHWKGTFDHLTMDNFQTSIESTAALYIQGKINNLSDPSQISGELLIDSLWLAGAQMQTLLTDSLLPPQTQLPQKIFLTGQAKGDLTQAVAKLKMKSSNGTFNFDGTFKQDTLTGQQTYDAQWKLANGNVQGILPPESPLGKLNIEGNITATSENFRNFQGKVDMEIDTFHFDGYNYTQIAIAATADQEMLSADVTVRDPHLVLDFSGTTQRGATMPATQAKLDLTKAQLLPLGFSEEELQLATQLGTNINGRSLDSITGKMQLLATEMITTDKRYFLDSLTLEIENNKTHQIKLMAPFIRAHYRGDTQPVTTMQEISQYLKATLSPLARDSAVQFPPINFELALEVTPHPLLSELLFPELSKFGGVKIEAQANSQKHDLSAVGSIWNLEAASLKLDSAGFKIAMDTTAQKLQLYTRNLSQQNFSIPYLQSTWQVEDETGHFLFMVKDKENREKYHIGTRLAYNEDHWQAHINSDSLLLNYQQWEVPQSNQISFFSNELRWQDLVFSHQKQEIILVQNPENKGVQIKFSKFQLATLVGIVTTKKIIEGTLGGTLTFPTSTSNSFSTNLTIQNLLLYDKPLFRSIELAAHAPTQKALELKGAFYQKNGKLTLQGQYDKKNKNNSEARLSMDNFDISAMQPFLSDQLEKLEGTLDGRIDFTVKNDRPNLNGNIQIASAQIKPKVTGTRFAIPSSSIAINNNQIKLSNFTVLDINNNKLTINGELQDLFITNPGFNMQLKANNFQWLTLNKSDQLPYYGNVNANITARAEGTLWHPSIEIDARLNSTSEVTYLLPNPQPVTIEQENLVIFRNKTLSSQVPGRKDTTEKKAAPKTIQPELTTRLEIDKEARLILMINPNTEERLEMQGEAALNFQQSPNGQQSLTGQYQITKGLYSTTLYQLIRRDFAIEKGSSLTWTGDPTAPTADITAGYRVRTSPAALVANEMTQMNEETRKQLARSMPFMVNLHIREQLLSPELSFEINLPPEVQAREVKAKLAQINANESEVNKHALSLLVLGSFAETNMDMSHPVSYEINATARSGLSSLLSNQLNKMAAKYVKGVDLNVGVTSYSDRVANQTETNTQVQIDMQKRFLNDRLSVQVGGKMNLEDEERQNTPFNSLAGNVVMLYDLTPDGRLKLKGFSTTEYENYLEGEITKTGVGIIFNRDYYRLRELFFSPADTTHKKAPKP